LLVSGLAAADPKTAFDRARALEAAGDLAAAESAYREFLKLDPQSGEGYGNLGVVLARQEKFEVAIGAYRHALRLRPALVALRLNLGLAYYKAERHELAVGEFRAYLRHDPENRQARQLLANALLETDQYQEAAQLYEALSPGDFAIRLGLATAYLRLRRTADARRLLDDLLRQDDSAEVQLLLAQAHLAGNEFAPAVQSLRRALELKPSLRSAHFLLGVAAWKQQDVETAVAEWRRELELDPRQFEPAFALGAALVEKGKNAEARSYLEKALVLRAAHAPSFYYLGKLAHAERKPEARVLLERAVKLDPSIRPAHYLLAQIYRAAGLSAQAERELAAVRRLSAAGVQQDIDIVQGR
jgi:tetratricopeptide (TPR) repeat protein